MVSTRDIALVGGLGLLVFLVTRAGRDLFGALPALSEGASGIGESISASFGSAGQSISEGAGGIGEAFSNLFGNIENPFAGLFQGPQQPTTPPPEPLGLDVQGPTLPGQSVIVDEPITPEGNPVLPFQLGTLSSIFNSNPEPALIGPVLPTIPTPEAVSLDQVTQGNIQSEIEGQQFGGGQAGDEFAGGIVREIPISRLSLSDIIDRFGVTASQAVDIRSRARDDFGDFDFGSNSGSGIGSVVSENPEISTNLPNTGAVSDSQFEGLSAEEIARRLTGGVISNF